MGNLCKCLPAAYASDCDAQVVSLDNGRALIGRLLLDVMGNASPIVRQIRWGQHPDGVCLVVGACARGFENNTTSDLIYTHTDVKQVGSSKTQYFWEVGNPAQ